MKANIKFIKEQFKAIADTHNLEWINESEYGVRLINEKILIKFSTDRWDEGIHLSVTDRIVKEYYYPADFKKNKGLAARIDGILSSTQMLEFDKLIQGDKDREGLVYYFRILIEDYCPEILDGDFSQVSPGKPHHGIV